MKNKVQIEVHPLIRLWWAISPRRRRQLFALLGFSLIAAAAEVFSLGMVIPFLGVLASPERIFTSAYAWPLIEIFRPTQPKDLLEPLAVVFCCATLAAALVRMIYIWARTRLTFTIGADLSNDIYRRTLYQPYSVHLSRNSSEVIDGISSKTSAVIFNILSPVLVIMSNLLMLVAILVAIFLYQPIIALVSFAGFGIIYGLIFKFTKTRLRRNSQQIATNSITLIKTLQEGLGGIRDVILDHLQEIYCLEYSRADSRLRRSQADNSITGEAPRFAIEALGMCLIAVLALSLAKGEREFSSTLPLLGVFAIAAQRLLPMFQQVYYSLTSLSGNEQSLKHALALLEQPLPQVDLSSNKEPILLRNAIVLQDAGFKYSEQGPWVIRNLNLCITKGSRVGFIGKTGGGKSTLLDIIMGLLPLSEGILRVDDETVTSLNNHRWQQRIAHVPQAIYLSDASIAQNIALGVPIENIDMQRVHQSARKAQLADTIDRWTLGYQTVVGERGIRLSGGQRQRIGIARALYKEADVLVFDEATSALDHETERAVMQAIELLGRELTILIVAHRISTLQQCDLVVELFEGQVHQSTSVATAFNLN